jgi:septal ring factor EnvC (AmiA/AmiB activator)
LLTFTVIVTIILAFSSWLLPNGRIHSAIQTHQQEQTAVLQQAKQRLPALKTKVDQLAARQATLDQQYKAMLVPTDAVKQAVDALDDDAHALQDELNKQPDNLQGLDDLKSSVSNVLQWTQPRK